MNTPAADDTADTAAATCTCEPEHLEVGATDPWCEVHGGAS
jgi:hypothetical protein